MASRSPEGRRGTVLTHGFQLPYQADLSGFPEDYQEFARAIARAGGGYVFQYDPASGSCSRSPLAYPALWSSAHQVSSFSFVACSGATTQDVLLTQADLIGEAIAILSSAAEGAESEVRRAVWRRGRG